MVEMLPVVEEGKLNLEETINLTGCYEYRISEQPGRRQLAYGEGKRVYADKREYGLRQWLDHPGWREPGGWR